MGRVVFFDNAEQGRWLRPEALLREIAPHQPSDPSIVPDGPAIDPHNSGSDQSGVVVGSSQRDILQFAELIKTSKHEFALGRTAVVAAFPVGSQAIKSE